MDARPRLKICGITNADDARLVSASGVDYCGILVDVQFSKRSLPLHEARQVIKDVTVLTHQYGAEFGRASGGILNVVTEHGTNTPFGVIMTGMGVISLAGVVVNNAIVMIDYINVLRRRGLPTTEAIVRAGCTRFRPVVLTAVTTILGLIPMAVGVSFDFHALKWIVGAESSQWWGAMASAVIFGLAVATLLTLLVVPALYSLLNTMRERIMKLAHYPTEAEKEAAEESADQREEAS